MCFLFNQPTNKQTNKETNKHVLRNSTTQACLGYPIVGKPKHFCLYVVLLYFKITASLYGCQ